MYPPSLHSRPRLWHCCPSPFLAAANLIQRWRLSNQTERGEEPAKEPRSQHLPATSVRPFPLP
ncbi:hypothetical protein ACFFLH_02575 [Balneatrix alpica]|uniref:Uncharacterized protein n=1 Tax=Balneatrix alpica TaxID=75684 RepID=A0ABV5Z8X9_9GAMM